jgi:uncharacterized protein (DUF1697 family)
LILASAELSRLHIALQDVDTQVPKGSTLDSTIGKTMGNPRYKSSTTTRNLRTLAKVLR